MAQVVKNLPANPRDIRDTGSIQDQEDPLEENVATHSSILAGESCRQRSLPGYSPCSRKELDITEAT